MATETSVCNQALLLLGERGLLSSYEEDTKNGRICRTFYPDTVKKAFEAYPWPFAKHTEALVRLSKPINGMNAFKLPAKFARFVRDKDSEEYPQEGQCVLSASDTLTINYIRCVEEGLWPGHFVDVVAALLASKLAYPITEMRSKSVSMYQVYKDALGDAKGAVGTVTRTDQSEDLRTAHR